MQKILNATRQFYQSRGMGKRIGFGQKPAVLVIDFQRGFTDEACPLGADYTKEIRNTRILLDAARDKNLPVFYTMNVFNGLSDAGVWGEKIEANKYIVAGSPWIELDERLGRLEKEMIVYKKFASSFFATSLLTQFISKGIDSVIISGCTTSGCVRATVVDGISYGYRMIIPRECVGDRHEIPHQVSLLDIDAKYGDVVALNHVLEYLTNL